MRLFKFIKNLFRKEDVFYVDKLPYNTIIDNKFFLHNNVNFGNRTAYEYRVKLFNQIEFFYKNTSSLKKGQMVLRCYDCTHSIVIIDPCDYDNGVLTLYAYDIVTKNIFSGKDDEWLERFKERLNEEIRYNYGFINSVKQINIMIKDT